MHKTQAAYEWNLSVRTLHGLLAKRLIVAWVLLSLVVGGAVTYLEIRRVDELALSLAASASESLRAHITAIGQQHADSLKVALAPLLQQGYAHARVTDNAGQAIAEVNAPDRAELLTYVSKKGHTPEVLFNGSHRVFWLDSELVVQVSFPILDRSGNALGSFYGVYQVDAATRQHAQMELVRNVSATLLAILVTTLALYPVIIGLNKGVLKLSVGLMRSNIELMEVLGSAIAKRDSDTDLHNYRVCLYSIRFAEAVGLSEKEICTLITGAFLHDAGKIGISDTILLKPGPLTPEEFSAMKNHVKIGADIVANSSWLKSARDVIEFHHEQFDGSGYLAGLKGDSIPLAARLFAIIDVFDALTSRRPYKEPFDLEDAMRILAGGRGSHFDPGLYDVFQKIGATLYREIFALTQTSLRRRVRDQVTKYFFESNDTYR